MGTLQIVTGRLNDVHGAIGIHIVQHIVDKTREHWGEAVIQNRTLVIQDHVCDVRALKTTRPTIPLDSRAPDPTLSLLAMTPTRSKKKEKAGAIEGCYLRTFRTLHIYKDKEDTHHQRTLVANTPAPIGQDLAASTAWTT